MFISQVSHCNPNSALNAKLLMRFTAKPLRSVMNRTFVLAASVVLLLAAFPGQSIAQDSRAAEPRKGDQILLLGTHGGPGLETDRSEPASLLIVDGRPYLIDCGIGTMRRLLRAGIRSDSIGTIFLTHDHPDHALGLVDVMSNDFLSVDFGARGPRPAFRVYGPPQTQELVQAAYNFIRIPYGIFAAEHLGVATLVDPFEAHDIAHDGVIFQDDKIRVIAPENTHYQLMPAKFRARMKSYAYRFETPYGVIVFTGDTGPSDAVVRLAKGADVLVSEMEDLRGRENGARPQTEAGREASERAKALEAHMRLEHLTTEEVGKMATKAQVKTVVLYHLVLSGRTKNFVSGVQEFYSGPVFAGEDLARYCLGAPGGDGNGSHALQPCQ